MLSMHLMKTYKPLPVAFSHGRGAWLTTTDGRVVLDALAGIAVSGLGHAHPKLVAAIAAQAAKLIHTSNLVEVPEQGALADKLCALAAMDNAFFCNSGAEANECAIKIARLYAHRRGIVNPQIIVMERAWHGRTLATLAATGSRKAQAGFEPLVTGFIRVPYNDIEAIRAIARHNPDVVAVLSEVVQGEGGIVAARVDYLRALRELCDREEWLLMIDEVQSGIGRTGKWFAHQWADIVPDVMPLAKGLGSGVPVGACLAKGAAAQMFQPGNHGSTFGGGPLASVAALRTLEIMEEEGLLARAAHLGALLKSGFEAALGGVAGVREIRGQGLMLGIELDRPCAEIVGRALEAGLLTNVTQEQVIRLLPPLILSDDEAGQIVSRLAPVIREFLAVPRAAT
ncbi:MAG TPA: aspartate aminotransferase family protein [Usitatibacteraceae bacterium]|nr:aspartate aminotransferase family protein [Usitatibacteraceae bacterium]